MERGGGGGVEVKRGGGGGVEVREVREVGVGWRWWWGGVEVRVVGVAVEVGWR